MFTRVAQRADRFTAALAIAYLHFADLGILHYCMGAVAWALADLGFFGGVTAQDHGGADCALKDACTSWFKKYRVPDHDRLVSLNFNMRGSRESPLLKMEAGKSRAALPFIAHLPRSAGGRDLLGSADPAAPEGSRLLEVGEGMLKYVVALCLYRHRVWPVGGLLAASWAN
eukprot:3696335-Pyramimonas_sp.AAC.1